MSSNTPMHPTLGDVRTAFQSKTLTATEFRGCTTLVVQAEDLHEVMHFLRQDPACDYNLLADLTAADYLDYPASQPARFGVTWTLRSYVHDRMLLVRVWLDPELDTYGIEEDPGLVVDSVTDIWPGSEWPEREVFDMFGIRFRGHPLRKDYPLRGRGERENHNVLDRSST